MILLECSPPFQWKPSLSRAFCGWRVMWGWFAVAYVDYGFNEFVEGIARAAVRCELKKPGSVLSPEVSA